MFKKILVIGASVLMICLQFNIVLAEERIETQRENVFVSEQTNLINEESVGNKHQKNGITLFGLYEKEYYKDLIISLDAMKTAAIMSMKCLDELEESLKCQQNNDLKNENMGSNVVKCFRDFLEQQDILDKEVISFFELMGLDFKTSENNNRDDIQNQF